MISEADVLLEIDRIMAEKSYSYRGDYAISALRELRGVIANGVCQPEYCKETIDYIYEDSGTKHEYEGWCDDGEANDGISYEEKVRRICKSL